MQMLQNTNICIREGISTMYKTKKIYSQRKRTLIRDYFLPNWQYELIFCQIGFCDVHIWRRECFLQRSLAICSKFLFHLVSLFLFFFCQHGWSTEARLTAWQNFTFQYNETNLGTVASKFYKAANGLNNFQQQLTRLITIMVMQF